MIKKECSVEGCCKQARSRGLCLKHYMRLTRTGSTDDPVVEDKTKHPLYITWIAAKRAKRLSTEWMDFWKFVSDVSPVPEGNWRIFREDTSLPYSKENCRWKEVSGGKKEAESYVQYDNRKRKARYKHGSNRARALMQIYGLTLEEYEAMHASQNGRCAICDSPEKMLDGRTGKLRNLAVDHCHKTGKVRGLLCAACNIGLGKFNDDPALMRKAAAFLDIE